LCRVGCLKDSPANAGLTRDLRKGRDDVARVDILHEGYVSGRGEDRVGSTVGLIRDGDAVVVVDPGLVADQDAILGPLLALGVGPGDVTDVVFSHHHPDHTLNAALFPKARFHDHWAIYRGDLWTSRPAEGFLISPDVSLIETPGHSEQDISTLVQTDEGLVAFTHLWWTAEFPVEDPYSPDPALLHGNRARLLEMPVVLMVPGHGPAFVPDSSTPR
jgi:glyoxylase-like metal-dependent hydrolase (beta-lactamase superfamily II)